MITWDDMIDSIRLDEVINALDIGILEVRKGEHWASCPLPTHPGADASPSFSINEDALVFNCFTCNEGGPLPLLVAALQGFETDEGASRFEKALEWLLPYSDADVDTDKGFMEQLERYLQRAESRSKRPPKPSLPFYTPKVVERLEYAPLELVSKWNICQEETVQHFGLRYDPERHRIKRDRSYTGPALIIPHYFGGDLVGYQERWLAEDCPDWIPKYTNSENFPKALTLYNWDGAVEEARRGAPVIVVESTMTVDRLWELGYTAVATFGASVRDEQIRLLSSLPGGAILAFDCDPDFLNAKGHWVQGAGKKALNDTATKLMEFIPVEAVVPRSDSKADLADLPEEEVHALLQARTMFYSPFGRG